MMLSLGATEDALATLEFSEQKSGRIICELIRMEQNDLNFSNYAEGVFHVFGQSDVNKARRILAGEELLINIDLHKDYTNMLDMYDRLTLKKHKDCKQNETT